MGLEDTRAVSQGQLLGVRVALHRPGGLASPRPVRLLMRRDLFPAREVGMLGGALGALALGVGGICAGLCLLQLQKLLQEATIVGKLVGNAGRVVCICDSRTKTEDREGELAREAVRAPEDEDEDEAITSPITVPNTPQHSHLQGPQTSPQRFQETTAKCAQQASVW